MSVFIQLLIDPLNSSSWTLRCVHSSPRQVIFEEFLFWVKKPDGRGSIASDESIMFNPLTMSFLHPATIRFPCLYVWLFLELKQRLVVMKVALVILLENYAPVSVCFPIQPDTESHVDVLAPLPGEGLPITPYNTSQPEFFACLNNRCFPQPCLCALDSEPLQPENVA